MNWSLFFAVASPAIFAFMNVFDTFIIKKKVKHVLGFVVVSAVTNVLLGVVLALFLDWRQYAISDYLFPILAGAVIGIQLCFYYVILHKHDSSHAIGLIYCYPIIVALLSFLFIGEKLSLLGYIGMVITLIGVLLLSVRIKKLKITLAIWSLGIVIIATALNEFFIKIAISNINGWNGTAIGSIVMGLFVIPLLLKKDIRKGFYSEFKNVKLTFVSEMLTLAGILTLYLAVIDLPVTIVSVISSVQPLFVLFFEWMAFSFGIKIVKDVRWRHKLFAIVLIILGIMLLYFSDIV